MAQAVSCRPLTAKARVHSLVSVHVGFVVDKVALDRFFSSDSVFPCIYHSTVALRAHK
jgi:hypothetical protein